MSNPNNYITSEEEATIISYSNNSELMDNNNEIEKKKEENNTEINKENINKNNINKNNILNMKKDNKTNNNEKDKKQEKNLEKTPKTIYSKISENLINYFYKTGKYPINVCLENLINDNILENEPILKINDKNKNDNSENQKIISRFLERNESK